jgi:hypothetical protein
MGAKGISDAQTVRVSEDSRHLRVMPPFLPQKANSLRALLRVVPVNDLAGNVLEVLREDDEFTLLRGHRRSDSCPILAVASRYGSRSGASLRRLENEYAIAGELEPAWAAIYRSIVEMHGGRLWVNPRLPNGSAFNFTVRTASAIFSVERGNRSMTSSDCI